MRSKTMLLFAVCLVGGFVCTGDSRVNGEDMGHWTHSRMVEGVRPKEFQWSDILGQRVVVEGVAWCSADPWGDYVILDGARVYVDFRGNKALVPSPVDPNRMGEGETSSLDAQKFRKSSGLSVRVTGTLVNERIKAGGPGSPGPPKDMVIYRIQNSKWEQLDRIEWPWLQLLKNLPQRHED